MKLASLSVILFSALSMQVACSKLERVVESAVPINKFIHNVDRNLRPKFDRFKEYDTLRSINGDVELAITLAYFEQLGKFTGVYWSHLRRAFIDRIKEGVEMADMKAFEASFVTYFGMYLLGGHNGSFKNIKKDWNTGNNLELIAFKKDLKAITALWSDLESTEDSTLPSGNSQRYLKNSETERSILVLSNTMQATIEVFEMYEPIYSLKHFRFDPQAGTPVMTIHLLLHGNKHHPTISILTPKQRRHCGLVEDDEQHVSSESVTTLKDDTLSRKEKSHKDNSTKKRSKKSSRLETSLSTSPKRKNTDLEEKSVKKSTKKQKSKVVDEHEHEHEPTSKAEKEHHVKRSSKKKDTEKKTKLSEADAETLTKNSKDSSRKKSKRSKKRHVSNTKK